MPQLVVSECSVSVVRSLLYRALDASSLEENWLKAKDVQNLHATNSLILDGGLGKSAWDGPRAWDAVDTQW